MEITIEIFSIFDNKLPIKTPSTYPVKKVNIENIQNNKKLVFDSFNNFTVKNKNIDDIEIFKINNGIK